MKYDFSFEDLEKDPFYKSLIEILEKEYGIPLSDDIKIYFMDSAASSQSRVNQRVLWVKTASTITQNIVNGVATLAEYPLFWIRLWGIIRELAPYLQRNRELIKNIKLFIPQLEAIDELMAALSNDDLILIDFMRHNHSHMHIDYVNYQAQAKKNGSLKITPPTNPNAIEIVKNIFNNNYGDQKRVAFNIANKIIKPLESLKAAIIASAEAT